MHSKSSLPDRPRPCVRLVLLWFAVCGSTVRADRIVTVRSVVDPAFAAQRSSADFPAVQTYVFARGQYFNAIPMDSVLERTDFFTIAKTLAADMRGRGLEPAKAIANADLVLVVHWGVTLENPNPAAFLLQDFDVIREASNVLNDAYRAAEDPAKLNDPNARILEGTVEAQIDLRRESAVTNLMGERDARGGHTNAELLGFQSNLVDGEKLPFSNAMGDAVRSMVNEERYFVIVIAYDARALREGRKRRLWTTRASIRAAGINFAGALDRLSATAAAYHGSPQTELLLENSRHRPRVRDGKVEVGEIKVIGDSGPPAQPTGGKR